MKTLVVGGAGYIGSVVTRLLLSDGHEVVVLDNCSTGHADSIPDGVQHIQADITTASQVLAGAGFDAVLHFAAKSLVGESVAKPSIYWHTNVLGSRALLDAITEHAVPRLVFSSTAAVYGEPEIFPITEDSPTKPTSTYGATKLAVDMMITNECAATELAAVSLRYFNVAGAAFGAGERHTTETHLIPIALDAVAGRREKLDIYGDDWPTPDGTPVRDYVHVEDLARAHVLALTAAHPGEHLICNLGNGNGFSVREVIAEVERVTGLEMPTVTGPRRPGDPTRLVASAARAKERLGWEPRLDLGRMVADAWAFSIPDRTAPTEMSSAAELFSSTFGSGAFSVYSAPGRVNLIGEHTDYNSGLVLPFAIDARTSVAAARNDDGLVRVVSAQRPEDVRSLAVVDILPGGEDLDWSAYVFGVYWALTQAGVEVGGVDLAIDSNVPVGAGLSSSAALECAVALAVSTLYGHELPLAEIARIAQRAENDFVGMPCGLMDQMASATCQEGSVLFFDIGHDTTENIPFDPSVDGLAILVIDTKAHHALADGEYAKRRASCEQAAAALGLDSLREIAFDDLDAALGRLDDDVLRRRVRHIVTENRRVENVVAQLRGPGASAIGPDMTASHVSLRDDFEVSCLELDVAVEAALGAGALGARMTGGGFGGSVIALVPLDRIATVGEAVDAAFQTRSLTPPVLRTVSPAQGARVD